MLTSIMRSTGSFTDREWRSVMDAAVIEALRVWAEEHRETIKPTGRDEKNLNPILPRLDALTPGWWGFLRGEKVEKWSINRRIEGLRERRGPLQRRALVPATYWREMSGGTWHHLGFDGELFAMAAVIQPGRLAGQEYTCYSLVMQPAAPQIEAVHDRMPLLIPAGFAEEWLTSAAPAGELLTAAQAASRPLSEQITAHPQRQSATLF